MNEKTMRKIEDRVTETKARSFSPPTNEAVVKAWEAFDKRVVAVYDPDTDVEIEPRGQRQVLGIGGAGDIIKGIELRKGGASPAEELDTWMKVSDFMGDVFPRFLNPDEDKALFIVDEWNNLMDAIADDEGEATPEIRQAAEDQKIVALGRQRQDDSVIGMEVYDNGADMDAILSLRKHDATATIIHSYTSSDGVHEATYVGWTGDDEIIYAGGYVNGSFVRPNGVDRPELFDQLSEDVKAELEPLAGGTCWKAKMKPWVGSPSAWNGKILEIQDDVDPKDAELLDALWIRAKVYDDEVVNGVVTVYGVDDGVTKMDEDDFEILGLYHRIYKHTFRDGDVLW